MMLSGPVLLEKIQLQKTFKNSFREEKYKSQTFWKTISTSFDNIILHYIYYKNQNKNVSIIQRFSSCPFNQAALSPQLQETSDLFYFVFPGFSLEWNQTHVFFHVLFLLLKITLEFIHTLSHFSSAFSFWTLSHRMNILLFLYSVTYWQLFEIFWLKATPSEAPESTQLHISE